MSEGAGFCAQGGLSFEPELVRIPAGTFWMGSSEVQIQWLANEYDLARKWVEKGSFDRKRPQHRVTLDDYWIGHYPVTVGQYRVFVEAYGYGDRRFWAAAGWSWRENRLHPDYWDDKAWAGDMRLPVVGVSWYEAGAYCRWLSEETGCGYRLPTEAGWEKAARGTDGRLWSWGNGFDAAFCNVRTTELGQTVPVGRYRSVGDSAFGCADMVGNV